MPELIRFSTALILNPYNIICYTVVVSAPKLAYCLNSAQHAVQERQMGKWVLVKAPRKTTFLTV